MKQKVTLHIGTPKTGTTALQCAFVEQLPFLQSNSISYPNITGGGFGWSVERGLSSGNGDIARQFTWHSDIPAERLTWLIEQALSGNDDKQNILLSSEILSMFAVKPFFWETLAALSKANSCTFEVVAYLRDPFAIFLSGYQQYVKTNSYSGLLSDYLNPFWNAGNSETFTLQKNISWVYAMADSAGIPFTTYRYEDAASGIEEHFFTQVLGIDPSTVSLPRSPRNTGMRVEDLHFHRGANSISPQMGQLLGFERGDLHLNRIHPARKSKMKLHLDETSQRALLDLFEQYRVEATKVLPFADRIDYGINHSKIVTELDPHDAESIEEFYHMGRFVASSYEAGYIKWGWETNFKRQSWNRIVE